MLFNSLIFAVFFPVVTAGYFALPHRHRWWWLLMASCGFYMWFVPAYILILGFTIAVDYCAGLALERLSGSRRRILLGCSLVANLGVLGLFKYFNFANENLTALAHALGWNYSLRGLELALPIGLSFHTFQAMSYTIEVYRGNQKAERHPGIFALYVLFYPQLVAGPIERPQNLLHQFREPHAFEYGRVTSGLRLMAWGLFKKMVIADRLAAISGAVFSAPDSFPGPMLVLGVVAFAFQIYGDFSGYSDVARGAARVMGFELMRNFDRPYGARSIAEFWRRWHISLSTWFRDYLYFPLGGNRLGTRRQCLNLLLVFLVSGLWHGAAWNFVIWGALHGMYLILGLVTKPWREKVLVASGLAGFPRIHGVIQMGITFALVGFAWIFFRAPSLDSAWTVLHGMVRNWHGAANAWWWTNELNRVHFSPYGAAAIAAFVAGMLRIEALNSRRPLEGWLIAQPWWRRWGLYYFLTAVVFYFQATDGDQFIYFQF